MDVMKLAERDRDAVVAIRRHLHENPELSGKEFGTIRYISSILQSYGIEHTEIENGGILATIKGPAEKDTGRSVLLRADCDALPIQEKENLNGTRQTWSKVDGVMHACGHDAHVAMLLGAGKILQENREALTGTVYLCFERGEEFSGNAKYILAYLEKHGYRIDTCFAIHVRPGLRTGVLAVNDGAVLGGIGGFVIGIEGKGGHGSRPDLADNPIDCFVAIYQRMQTLRLTKIPPFKPLSYSVGKLEAGSQANIIPQKLEFSGTVRYYDDESVSTFVSEMRLLVDSTCRAYHCTPQIKYLSAYLPATINDPAYAAFAREIFSQQLGADNVVQIDPETGSDSFGQYIRQWPGCYAFLGVNDPEKGTGAIVHNEQFDLDEDSLPVGVACHVLYAQSFLNSGFSADHAKKIPFSQLLKEGGRLADLMELYGGGLRKDG